MNYLQQIKGFWVVQNAHSLGIEEVGLYFHLLEISNTLRWMNPFKRNNSKVMSDLGIKDRRTLDRYRNRLKQAGALNFETKNGDANVTYSLIDLSIYCTGFGIGDGIGSRIGNGIGDGIDNINKGKRKQRNSETNVSGGLPPPQPIIPPKKKKKENTTEFWPDIVSTWFSFYEAKYQLKPSFTVTDGRSLKSIIDRLKKFSIGKGYEWTMDYAVKVFTHFLTKAHTNKWLKEHFLLKNLASEFDAIVTPENGTKTSNNGKTDLRDYAAQLAAGLTNDQGNG